MDKLLTSNLSPNGFLGLLFLPHGMWSSHFPFLEVFFVPPSGLLNVLLLHSPYPSIFFHSIPPSPYPSILSLSPSLFHSKPPSLIPPFSLPPQSFSFHSTSHPPSTAGSHLVPLPEGSPHFMCCPASSHTPAAWTSLSLHLSSDNVGFMAHLPQVNCPLLLHTLGLITPSTMSSP